MTTLCHFTDSGLTPLASVRSLPIQESLLFLRNAPICQASTISNDQRTARSRRFQVLSHLRSSGRSPEGKGNPRSLETTPPVLGLTRYRFRNRGGNDNRNHWP